MGQRERIAHLCSILQNYYGWPIPDIKPDPIMIRVNHDVCKEMVKDLLDEIRKEEAGEVLD